MLIRLFLLVFPFTLAAQNPGMQNAYRTYQKSIPAYHISEEEVRVQIGDSLRLIRNTTESWTKNEHTVIRREALTGNCPWEAHSIYSEKDTTRIILRSSGCGKPEERLTEIHGPDSIIIQNDHFQVLATTVFDAANHTQVTTRQEDEVTIKTVTAEDKNVRKEEEFRNGQLQMRRLFFGKENRYDSILYYNENNVLFLRTVYLFNAKGDIDRELEYRISEDAPLLNKTNYTYIYDVKGNWTKKKSERKANASSSPSSSETIWIYTRKLTY